MTSMDESERSASVYSEIAEEYAKEFSEPTEHIDGFLDRLPDDGKVLDIGCGTGKDAGYMNSKGFKVTGIDLSEEMIEMAREKYAEIDFREEDARNMSFSRGSFDGVTALFSLIHLPKKDVPAVMEKINEFLKEDGTLFLAVYIGESDEVKVEEPFKPGEKHFLNVFSRKELEKLLSDHGFLIEKSFEQGPGSGGEFNYGKLFLIARKESD